MSEAGAGAPLARLQERIGYRFRDASLLVTALTHSSYANENRSTAVCNERLEFLGDSVLGMLTARFLYERFPELPEGELTKLRAALVCESSLAGFAREIALGNHLRLGHGERQADGARRPSLLADAFESLLAALYLDSSSLEETQRFLLPFLTAAAEKARRGSGKDYKTRLQELAQRDGRTLVYCLLRTEGPDHARTFYVDASLDGERFGEGSGRSKKEAEQMAAQAALRRLESAPR